MTTDETINTQSIVPVHEARDQDKLASLIESMGRDGWIGRPIVVVDLGNETHALTGSHRLAAAASVGLDGVPVVWAEIDWDLDLGTYSGEDNLTDIKDHLDNPALIAEWLRRMGSTAAAEVMAAEGQ